MGTETESAQLPGLGSSSSGKPQRQRSPSVLSLDSAASLSDHQLLGAMRNDSQNILSALRTDSEHSIPDLLQFKVAASSLQAPAVPDSPGGSSSNRYSSSSGIGDLSDDD